MLLLSSQLTAQSWEPYTGAENLRRLMSDTEMEGAPREGVTSTARYNKDGTGELTAWGETFSRTWRVQGDDQVCVSVGEGENCVRLEKDTGKDNVYRAIDLKSGEVVEFSVRDAGEPIVIDGNRSTDAERKGPDEIGWRAIQLFDPSDPGHRGHSHPRADPSAGVARAYGSGRRRGASTWRCRSDGK